MAVRWAVVCGSSGLQTSPCSPHTSAERRPRAHWPLPDLHTHKYYNKEKVMHINKLCFFYFVIWTCQPVILLGFFSNHACKWELIIFVQNASKATLYNQFIIYWGIKLPQVCFKASKTKAESKCQDFSRMVDLCAGAFTDGVCECWGLSKPTIPPVYMGPQSDFQKVLL